MENKKFNTPLSEEDILSLKTGDMIFLTGTIYTARDAAHKKLVELLDSGQSLPLDINNKIVYYAGPCPNKPGQIIGSVGPTTSGRMDSYSPRLIEKGLKVMIGKGKRDEGVKEAIVKHKGLYLAAIGGAAALISQCVKEVQVVAFPELGTEAIRKLYVEDFPLIVAIDSTGNDVYER